MPNTNSMSGAYLAGACSMPFAVLDILLFRKSGGKGILTTLFLTLQVLQIWPKWVLTKSCRGRLRQNQQVWVPLLLSLWRIPHCPLRCIIRRGSGCVSPNLVRLWGIWLILFSSAQVTQTCTSYTHGEKRGSLLFTPNMTVSHTYAGHTLSVFSGSYLRSQVFTANLLSKHIWNVYKL